jgi:predicted MFS family arabinose efflux permease
MRQSDPPATVPARRPAASLRARPSFEAGTSAPRGFWLAAAAIALFLAASSAPSPIYAIYAQQWHFSAFTLTFIFAVYAVTLLAALLALGTLSDRLGRKTVILVALGILAAGELFFLCAQGVAWLVVARALQGLATGLLTSAASAALLDLVPPKRPGLPALVNSSVSTVGITLGAVGSGALAQYARHPTRLVYVVLLIVIVALTAAIIVRMDETVSFPRSSQARRWGVPPDLRRPFLRALPGLIATWAISGFYLSLGSSLASLITHSSNHLLTISLVAILSAAASISPLVLRGWSARTTTVFGCGLLAASTGATALAVSLSNPVILWVSAFTGGLGFGAGFVGALRSLLPLAQPSERGSLAASIYTVAYLSFSVPVIGAGILTVQIGLRPTAVIFSIAVSLLALAASLASAGQRALSS